MTIALLGPIEGERTEVWEAPAPVRPITIAELLKIDVRPRSMLLAPIIPEKGLIMVYGARGTGKTLLAQSVAYAVASGTGLLRWSAPTPKRVLYIDGEMPLTVLKERFAAIMNGAEREAPADHLLLLAADHLRDGLPNLAGEIGQALIEPMLCDISLVVVDNLSTLAETLRDNDADAWSPMQKWLLGLRRRGVSVMLVHHAGKGGQQRGTSRREDVLDTVIALRRPGDYRPAEGARFEVHIEKARGCYGTDVTPFEARYEVRDGAARWIARLADVDLARVVAGLKEGMSLRKIAARTGIPKSTVHRLKKKAEGEGLL